MSFFAHTLAKYFSYVLFTYISICTMQNTLGVKRNKKNLRSCYELNFIFRNLKEKKFRMIKRSCLVLNRTQIQKTINYYFNQILMINPIWSTTIKLRTHLNSPKISNVEPTNRVRPNTKRSYCCYKKAFFGKKMKF